MNTQPQLQQEQENHIRYGKIAYRIALIAFIFSLVIFFGSVIYVANNPQTTTEDPPKPTPPRTPPITPMQEHYNALDTFQYSDGSKGTSRFDWDARKRGILINN